MKQLCFNYVDGGNAKLQFSTLSQSGPDLIKFWENYYKTYPDRPGSRPNCPKSFIRVCIYKGKIIAWAMSYLGSLSCYTQSKYRKMGIQKNYLIPYMKKHALGLDFIKDEDAARSKTFSYYK